MCTLFSQWTKCNSGIRIRINLCFWQAAKGGIYEYFFFFLGGGLIKKTKIAPQYITPGVASSCLTWWTSVLFIIFVLNKSSFFRTSSLDVLCHQCLLKCTQPAETCAVNIRKKVITKKIKNDLKGWMMQIWHCILDIFTFHLTQLNKNQF